MKRISIIFLLIGLSVWGQEDREVKYIKDYARLAVREMHKYKIPASITLAQGILETGGGQSRLAEKAKNHFGIKCKKEWKGATITHDDDAIGECFRKYNSVEESYRDHSKFLAERPYYKNLFKLNLRDYKAWAHGLKKAGYATNPKYAPILISKIKKHKLYEFDKIELNDVEKTLAKLYDGDDGQIAMVDPLDLPNESETVAVVEPAPSQEPIAKEEISDETEVVLAQNTQGINIDGEDVVVAVNEPQITEEITPIPEEKTLTEEEAPKEVAVVAPKPQKRTMKIPKRKMSARSRLKRHPIRRQYIIVEKGETIHQISKLYKIDENRLLRVNELNKAEDLTAGQVLFFADKKNKGSRKKYTVKKGDNMYLISQKAGMKLNKLYKRNRMKPGEEPQVGEILYLQGKRPKKRK